MKRVPNAGSVTRAIRSVRLAAKRCLKSLNAAAAKRMAKGDYVGAESLAARGRQVVEFQASVDALLQRWKEVQGAGGHISKKPVTPLWQYYQPVLRALAQLGGEARRPDLEPIVENLMSATFQPGDREEMTRGRQRWREMIRRAHKPLVAEGWLEKKGGLTWRITEAGRRAAERGVTKESGTRK